MEKLTCMLVDDEPLALRLLENYVARVSRLELLGSFTSSFAALEELRRQPVNLLFLDIQMPDLDGMELSRMIPRETRVVFTTAFKDYAFESYEVRALDFLLKPIRFSKFLEAVEKAEEWFALTSTEPPSGKSVDETAALPSDAKEEQGKGDAEGRSSLFIRVDGELRQVSLEKLLFVMGMKDYVVFQMENEKLTTHLTMTAAEALLPAKQYMRVNRSYIVALDKIRKVDRNSCVYIGKEIVHVTEAYRERFDKWLGGNLAK